RAGQIVLHLTPAPHVYNDSVGRRDGVELSLVLCRTTRLGTVTVQHCGEPHDRPEVPSFLGPEPVHAASPSGMGDAEPAPLDRLDNSAVPKGRRERLYKGRLVDTVLDHQHGGLVQICHRIGELMSLYGRSRHGRSWIGRFFDAFVD